jgi:hypothetical protein
MPPKKGTSTPNKPPDNPTWTLDEGEEMRRDINDLQKKIVTKVGTTRFRWKLSWRQRWMV